LRTTIGQNGHSRVCSGDGGGPIASAHPRSRGGIDDGPCRPGPPPPTRPAYSVTRSSPLTHEGVIMNRRLTRRAVMSTAAATAALGMTGCLQNPDPAGGGGGGTVEKYTPGDTPGSGTVTILGAFGGQERDAFLASLEDFQADSGITIEYTPDTDFTNTIQQRVGAGAAPDIALFPQPGGMFDLAAQG